MSFSSEVKQELLLIEPKVCCETAESAALLMFGREFSSQRCSLMTETGAIAAAYAGAVHAFLGQTPPIYESESGNFKVEVADPASADALVAEIRSMPFYRVTDTDDAGLSPCCIAAFVRGAFLACGTMTDPAKGYHLEFSCSAASRTAVLLHFLRRMEVQVKQIVRNSVNILYLKSSAQIEDLLSKMGATEQSMMLMGAKVYKDIRNTVNRRVNFENANIARSMSAALRQYTAIEKIMATGGLDSLPAELRECARLRFENIELSTAEIARQLPEPITVSGVNHRMKRIQQIADARIDPGEGTKA